MKIYGNSNIYLRQYYPYIYVSSTTYGNGAVNNPTNILGNAPDGAYTQLYGGNYGDGGMVVTFYLIFSPKTCTVCALKQSGTRF